MAVVEVENPWVKPEWLNQNFLKTALKGSFRRGSLQFTDWIVTPATNRGDNYLSQMYRVSAVVISKLKDPEAMSVVIKSLPKGELAEKFMEETQFFTIERLMLAETLPAMHKLLEGIGENNRLFAKLFYHQGPPNDLLILEDLRKSGFQSVDRMRGLDLPHCLLVMESIASLHAASLKAMEINSDIKTRYRSPFFCRKNSNKINGWILQSIEILADCVDEWGYKNDLSTKIRNFKEGVLEKMYDSCEMKEEEFNVLTHADMWTNNFMFKYNNAQPIAMKFVDFQISNYNSPLTDLLYFLFTSPQPYVRANHLQFLLGTYYHRLSEICAKLDFPLEFSFENLKEEFLKKLVFGFIVSISIFPIVVAHSDDITDFDEKVKNDCIEAVPQNFKTLEFKNNMATMLPIFVENGLFG